MAFKDIRPVLWQLLFPHPEEKWSEEGWKKKRAKPTAIGSSFQNLVNICHFRICEYLSQCGDGINTALTLSLHHLHPQETKTSDWPLQAAFLLQTPAFLCNKLMLPQCMSPCSLAVQGCSNNITEALNSYWPKKYYSENACASCLRSQWSPRNKIKLIGYLLWWSDEPKLERVIEILPNLVYTILD